MKNVIKAFGVSSALVLLSVAACSPAKSKPLALTEADAGKTVTLTTGDIFGVSLRGNRTTGYNWEMVAQDPAVLRQLGASEVTPDSNLIGAPGTIALRFEAVKAGQAKLKLIYRRSFEKDVPPQNTFEVTVVVK